MKIVGFLRNVFFVNRFQKNFCFGAGILWLSGCSPMIDPNLIYSSTQGNHSSDSADDPNAPITSSALSLTSVSPSTVSTLGGVQVTLTGTGFVPGMTVTIGGVTCKNPAYYSSVLYKCITGANPSPGTYDVVVTASANASATLASSFGYAAPEITSISPTEGPSAGGTTLMITGKYFGRNATVRIGKAGTGYVSCDSLTVVSSTSISCRTGVAPALGSSDVEVTQTDGFSGTLSNGFSYQAPVVTGITPTFGSSGGNTTVTITGKYFATNPTIKIGVNTCSSVTYVSSTTLTCITGTGNHGTAVVQVTNSDNQTGTYNFYNYVDPPLAIGYAANPAGYAVGSNVSNIATVTYASASSSSLTFSISPALPSGLSMDTTTGTISGTPVGPLARTAYTVTATNSVGSKSVTLYLSVADFGDGSDGSLSVALPETADEDDYAYITDASVAAGSNVVTVEDVGNLSEGNEVLLIQMQNTSSNHRWEFNTIQTVLSASKQLILSKPLTYSYVSGTPNVVSSVGAKVAQIIRVRHYSAVSISANYTAPQWNGKKGGVLVFKSQSSVNVSSGALNVDGKGFRGGDGDSTIMVLALGEQGESWRGLGTSDWDQNYEQNYGGGRRRNSKGLFSIFGGVGEVMRPMEVRVPISLLMVTVEFKAQGDIGTPQRPMAQLPLPIC